MIDAFLVLILVMLIANCVLLYQIHDKLERLANAGESMTGWIWEKQNGRV